MSQSQEFDYGKAWETEELFDETGDPMLDPLEEQALAVAPDDDDLFPPDLAIDDDDEILPGDEPPS